MMRILVFLICLILAAGAGWAQEDCRDEVKSVTVKKSIYYELRQREYERVINRVLREHSGWELVRFEIEPSPGWHNEPPCYFQEVTVEVWLKRKVCR